MMVNGIPRWTCRTHVSKAIGDTGEITIAPLRNLPVIKDLVTNMDPFFDKWVKAEGAHHPTKTRHDPIEALDTTTPARLEANKAIECINCAVCYAACDVVTANPDYLGPAALNRAWSLVNDEKDGARDQVLQAVSQGGGCHNCHSHQSCMTYCPNDLNPTASIAGLKRETTKAVFRLATFGGNK
jgi:fumarate reductase iron-sulfur subunit